MKPSEVMAVAQGIKEGVLDFDKVDANELESHLRSIIKELHQKSEEFKRYEKEASQMAKEFEEILVEIYSKEIKK